MKAGNSFLNPEYRPAEIAGFVIPAKANSILITRRSIPIQEVKPITIPGRWSTNDYFYIEEKG
jgi:hypothetical protein